MLSKLFWPPVSSNPLDLDAADDKEGCEDDDVSECTPSELVVR
jgi:hypothetical protein